MRRAPRVHPSLVLGGGVLVVALFLALTTSLQVSVLASLDEAVYKLSAAQYASGGVQALLDDRVARGVARLYSLVIAPLFAVLPGDTAVKAARAFSSLLFALTAVPVFLLARRVTTSPWAAVAAGLLSILVPWATLGTVLFSEALAYPLFACTVLAMVAALRAPTPRRDALVLVLLAALVLTRVQFLALPVAWLGVLLWAHLPEARRGASGRAMLVALWRRAPVFGSVLVAGVLVLLAGAVIAGPLTLARRLTGPYLGVRNQLPDDVGMAFLFELGMLALGTGLVPLVLAAIWWRRALGGTAGADERRLAVVGAAMTATTWLVAVLAQRGFQGPDVSEERYYVYAAPLVFVAAVAALDLPGLRTRTLAKGGALVVCLLALVPTTAGLSGERAFLVPVAASARNVADRINPWLVDTFGLVDATGQRDLLVLVALLVFGLALLGWRRARWLALVPALVLQLAFGGYALATMHGAVPGVPGVTPAGSTAELAWIDRETPGGGRVVLLDDRPDPERADAIDLAFWNDEVRGVLRMKDFGQLGPEYPVSALPEVMADVGPDLLLTREARGRLLTAEASPVIQLAGRPIVRRPGSGVVLEPERPLRATWLARGLGTDGGFTAPVQVAAAPARLTLTFEAAAEGPGGSARVTLGGAPRTATVPAGQAATVRVNACRPDGPVTGTIDPTGPPEAGLRLRTVRAEPCP